jgi:hypothetical protein
VKELDRRLDQAALVRDREPETLGHRSTPVG